MHENDTGTNDVHLWIGKTKWKWIFWENSKRYRFHIFGEVAVSFKICDIVKHVEALSLHNSLETYFILGFVPNSTNLFITASKTKILKHWIFLIRSMALICFTILHMSQMTKIPPNKLFSFQTFSIRSILACHFSLSLYHFQAFNYATKNFGIKIGM